MLDFLTRYLPPLSINSLLLLLTTLLLSLLSFKTIRKVRLLTRWTGFLVGIGASSTAAILAAAPMWCVGRGVGINMVLARTFRFIGPFLTGIKCEIHPDSSAEYYPSSTSRTGKHTPIIYIANHQSTLDMHFMAHALPERTVITAKKEVKWIPFMGWVMWAGGNIFIDRGNRTSAVDAMNKVGDRMVKDNLNVWVFPEGTRSHQKDKSLLPFKKGCFHLAKQHGFIIVPVVASTFWPVYGEKNGVFERGTIYFKVLPPIRMIKEETVDELIKRSRDAMLESLQGLDSVLEEGQPGSSGSKKKVE